MRILIEGQSYFVNDLVSIFNDSSFYTQKGNSAVINSVGYYYSRKFKEVVYMLPKVFMSSEVLDSIQDDFECQWDKNLTVFRKHDNSNFLTVKELFEIDKLKGSIKHHVKYEWIRRISINFYYSLLEFKKRNKKNLIMNLGGFSELNTNFGDEEYSYIDIVLSFKDFYRKSKTIFFFRHVEHLSTQIKKPKWEKTIRKTSPFIDNFQRPIYLNLKNKKKVVDYEEELIIYFLSILDHLNIENNLNLTIDKSYPLIKGEAFSYLLFDGVGLSKLRKIKYKYYSDIMQRMYKLCELYFTTNDTGSVKRRDEEYISFRKYNIVFEDMIDKLLSDEIALETYDKKLIIEDLSISKLKYNDDGKIIDHLFEHKGLIDSSNVFYIGDSKYYKIGRIAEKLSIYKQFTYAKNIIQYNIDLFNKRSVYASDKVKYRDEITEGYNISPNFLLYGFVVDQENYKDDFLEPISREVSDSVRSSYHFKTRLFDRDTLFIYQYKINYLFVLNAYTEKNESFLNEYRITAREKFRNNFIHFFESIEYSNFQFYSMLFNNLSEIKDFVDANFKLLNGRIYSINGLTLIIAIYNELKLEKNSKEWEEVKELKQLLLSKDLDLEINSKDIFKFNESKVIPYKQFSEVQFSKAAEDPYKS